MIGSCPECGGKLSSLAPSCPHCGFLQAPAATRTPPEAGKPEGPARPPDFIPPSKAVLREAARRQWAEWNYDSFWPMAFGILVMLVILGVAGIVVFLNRARPGP